jgi:hypothetical protein
MTGGILDTTGFRIPSRLIALLLIAALPAAAHAGPAEVQTISAQDVKPGMKGYGLTVFSGTAPEKFDVEVVAVVPNFLLKQSLILIRCSHPIIDKAGIIGGMSGSPIYIEGKLAGALAYGWHFQKEPLAGVTPIQDMLDVLRRTWRGDVGRTPFSMASALPSFDSASRHGRVAYETLHESVARDGGGFSFSATPLSLSGFLGAARQMLEEVLAPFGLDPVQGGGGGDSGPDPGAFVPGGAIGVQLIRGDMSATGIGTVTYADGEDVLAFGHPMFNMGEGALPVATARIHTVIAAMSRSNKLGSPIAEHGALRQDRQAAISARTDARAPMIPVEVRIRDERGRRDARYAVEVVSHPLLTPRLVHAALVEIIENAAADAEDVTADIEGTMRLKGRAAPIVLRDAGASRQGLSPLASYFRPAGLVGAVLDNPFEDAEIESLDFDVQLRYGLEVSTVIAAYVTAEAPAAGEVISVHVRLRSYGGDEQIVSLPLRVPDVPEGTSVTVDVGGGDAIVPPMAAPQSLEDLIANVQRFFPSRSIVVGTSVPREGIALRGRLIDQLPDSAAAALKPMLGTDQVETYRAVSFETYPAAHVVAGKETITFTVGPRRNR